MQSKREVLESLLGKKVVLSYLEGMYQIDFTGVSTTLDLSTVNAVSDDLVHFTTEHQGSSHAYSRTELWVDVGFISVVKRGTPRR